MNKIYRETIGIGRDFPSHGRGHTISRDNQRVNALTLIPQIDQEIDRAWQWKTNIGFLYYGFNLIRWHFMNMLPRHLSRLWKIWCRGGCSSSVPTFLCVLDQPTRLICDSVRSIHRSKNLQWIPLKNRRIKNWNWSTLLDSIILHTLGYS